MRGAQLLDDGVFSVCETLTSDLVTDDHQFVSALRHSQRKPVSTN